MTRSDETIRRLIAARSRLRPPSPTSSFAGAAKAEAEGGCGVVGLACTTPVVGRHILVPCRQMHNRGNGKGGGLAAAGLIPEQMDIDAAHLASDYLIHIALLDPAVRDELLARGILLEDTPGGTRWRRK